MAGCPEEPSGTEDNSTTITITAITGVIAPVKGAPPVNTITATDQFTGTVSWSGNPATFEPSTSYTATITLTAKSGYTFRGVLANSFTVEGASGQPNNAANSGVITAVFPQTAAALHTTQLDQAIIQAELYASQVFVADAAEDAPLGAYWVTQPQMDTYLAAIDAAKTMRSSAEDQEDIENALYALGGAVENFEIAADTNGTGTKISGFTPAQVTTLIGLANADKAGVKTSEYEGDDISPLEFWANSVYIAEFNTAITELQNASGQDATDTAYLALIAARQAFAEAKRLGTTPDKEGLEEFLYNVNELLSSIATAASAQEAPIASYWATAAQRADINTAITNATTMLNNSHATVIQVNEVYAALEDAGYAFMGIVEENGLGKNTGNAFSTAIQLIRDIEVTGELSDSVPRLWYKFDVNQRSEYRVWLNDHGFSTSVDSQIAAFYSDATEIFNEDLDNDSVTFIADRVGTVYVMVSRLYTNESGSFKVKYENLGNPFDDAVALAEGVKITGSITETEKELWYSFPVIAGKMYNIIQTQGDNYVYTTTAAFYSGGSEISEKNGYTLTITFVASADDTVYVKVSPYSAGYTGNFGLMYENFSNILDNAVLLTHDTRAQGSITETVREIWYRFPAGANQLYQIWGYNSSPLDCRFDVYNSSGTKVIDMVYIPSSINRAYYAESAGAVYVRVYAYYDYDAGNNQTYGDFEVKYNSTELPGPPLNITIGDGYGASPANYNLQISWSQVTGAAGYIVYRSNTLNGTYAQVVQTNSASQTSVNDNNAIFGQTYYYKVATRFGTNQTSVQSAAVEAKGAVLTPITADVQIIGEVYSAGSATTAPWYSLEVQAGSYHFWLDGADILNGFTSGGGHVGGSITLVEAGAGYGTYTATETVTIYIKATSWTSGTSVYSLIFNTSGTKPLVAPAVKLEINYSTPWLTYISWADISGVDSYTVYRSTNESSGYTSVSSGSENNYYQDYSTVVGTTYYYKVASVKGAQEVESAPLQVTAGSNIINGPALNTWTPVQQVNQITRYWYKLNLTAGTKYFIYKNCDASTFTTQLWNEDQSSAYGYSGNVYEFPAEFTPSTNTVYVTAYMYTGSQTYNFQIAVNATGTAPALP